MHLYDARLCLDCEELHTADRCPCCASDAFAFLNRWIPSNERPRAAHRRPEAASRPLGRPSARALRIRLTLSVLRWLGREAAATPPAATSGGR